MFGEFLSKTLFFLKNKEKCFDHKLLEYLKTSNIQRWNKKLEISILYSLINFYYLVYLTEPLINQIHFCFKVVVNLIDKFIIDRIKFIDYKVAISFWIIFVEKKIY